jgi:hypothetical protein
MVKDKLYRLMDVLDEIKKIESQLSHHEALGDSDTVILKDQYRARKEQLLVYFINELNASSLVQTHCLGIIKQIMEKFYRNPGGVASSEDEDLFELEQAISA